MKRNFFGFCAAAAVLSLAACTNNDGKSSATGDSASTTTTTATETTNTTATASEGSYAAMADTIERNATAGYYVNPRTGKKYTSLKVNRSTGRITDESGEPVWRYVDNRNWWVYGDTGMDSMSSWSQSGEARMDKDKLMYKGDGDKWVDYDTRYKTEDEDWIKKRKVSDGGNKQKIVTEDGDKIKVKTDEEGNTKIKMNNEKIKVDKDGNVKKD